MDIEKGRRCPRQWHLYIIRCAGGSLYTGITTNVARRFAEHRGDRPGGSKYLRGKGPLVLELKKRVGSKSVALKIESRVKRLSKGEKEKLLISRSSFSSLIKILIP